MEFDKTSKVLETFRKSVILELLKDLSVSFTITNENNSIVKLEELKNIYLNTIKIRCVAVNNNGNQCKKNNYKNGLYCKTHYSLNEEKSTNIKETITINKQNIDDFVNSKNLTKILINDSFYFIDCKYIYELKTLEKVGYINSNGKYILTDDPFLLEIN
jgi:flagellar hook assembly protein FlgD